MNSSVARIVIDSVIGDDWLESHDDLFLCDDLNNYTGQQYTALGTDIFGCFLMCLNVHWRGLKYFQTFSISSFSMGKRPLVLPRNELNHIWNT